MELELAQVLELLFAWCLPLDDGLSRGVLVDESFVDGVQDGRFDVMVEAVSYTTLTLPTILSG